MISIPCCGLYGGITVLSLLPGSLPVFQYGYWFGFVFHANSLSVYTEMVYLEGEFLDSRRCYLLGFFLSPEELCFSHGSLNVNVLYYITKV